MSYMVWIMIGIIIFFVMILSLEAVPSNMTVMEFLKEKFIGSEQDLEDQQKLKDKLDSE